MSKKNMVQRLALAGAFVVMGGTAMADAPTDIGGVITAVGGYQTAAIVVGIAILLFVLGRRVVRKLI